MFVVDGGVGRCEGVCVPGCVDADVSSMEGVILVDSNAVNHQRHQETEHAEQSQVVEAQRLREQVKVQQQEQTQRGSREQLDGLGGAHVDHAVVLPAANRQ